VSIATKRLTAYLDQVAQEAMKSGRLPDPVEVRRALAIFARDRTLDGPSLKIRSQPYRGTFDVEGHNLMVGEIVEDLGFLFAEQVDQANRLLRAVNDTEVKYGAFMHQIDTLEDLLEVLLLVEPKSTGYFYSVGDQFRDLAKVDQENTTAELQTQAGLVTLPIAAGVRKIGMPHLAERADIVVINDDDEAVVGSMVLPGSKYGYAFDDTARGWQQRIVSSSADGWSGYITVPVSAQPARTDTGGGAELPQALETREIYISRIDLDGLNETVMEVKILHSIDGENYFNLPGYDWVKLEGRRQSLYFERTKIEFLRILMRTNTPDFTWQSIYVGGELRQGPFYRYVPGFKSISIYDVGFAIEGELRSKELDPGTDTDIGRVVLDVSDSTPPGTQIEYYVAPYSSSPGWQRIQPLSRAVPDSSPIVDFTQAVLSPRRDNRLLVTSTPSLDSSRNGISFYNIGALNSAQISDSVKLFRGVGGWYKEINNVEELVTVRDNFVIFTRDDSSQQLYLEVEEEITNPTASDGTNSTILRTKRHIFYGDQSINVKPARTVSNQIPDYAIKQVLLLKATAPAGSGTVAITGTPRTIAYTPSGMTPSQINEGDYLYMTQGSVAGFFKTLVVTDDGTNVYVELDDPESKLVDGTATWSANSSDITQSVEDIINDTFTVDAAVTIVADDMIIITYRSPLNPLETPLSSSVVVKDSQGGTTYELGRDYTFDPVTKSVTRRPEGRITVTGDSRIIVRVSFQFKRLTRRLDTYTAWFLYEGDGSPVEMGAAIAVDDTAGESVHLQANDDRVLDLSQVTSLEGLARGWRRLTIRSKPLLDTTGAVDTATAIYKVINAVDAEAHLLFGPAHFSDHRGVKQPMKPVTRFYLQTSVGKDDRDVFAVHNDNVIINWDPTTNTDMVYLPPGTSTVLARERFEVEYKYQGGSVSVRSLLFRAVLSRNEGVDADRTPVLYWYNLRLAR
jgi:hypothetical protein